MRKVSWMAICGTVLSSAVALAQPPYPYFVPILPAQLPGPLPADPRLPPGSKPMSRQVPNEGGLRRDAGEPYLVPLEPRIGNAAQPSPDTAPEIRPGNPVIDGFNCFVQYLVPNSPSEPYATYEGTRYMAEIKHDNTRVWAQASFIHWWIGRDYVPPLVTTGALGADGTMILLGDGAVNPREMSGVQASVGRWLDPERLVSRELGGFYLGSVSRQASVSSDANGAPALRIPLRAPEEFGFFLTDPGILAGNVRVTSVTDLHGLEWNHVRNSIRFCGWSFDYLLGLRYVYLNDALSIDQNLTPLVDGVFMANGNVVPAGANVRVSDSFHVTNRFYGGQIGARVNRTHARWDFGVVGKIAFGATHHVASIDGTTTFSSPGAEPVAIPGGVLAQPSNSGRFSTTSFSVIPELNATASFQVSQCLRIYTGYSVLYWTRVNRAGEQIDRTVNVNQAPTSPTFVQGAGGPPVYPDATSSFWAQGINIGIELKF